MAFSSKRCRIQILKMFKEYYNLKEKNTDWDEIFPWQELPLVETSRF